MLNQSSAEFYCNFPGLYTKAILCKGISARPSSHNMRYCPGFLFHNVQKVVLFSPTYLFGKNLISIVQKNFACLKLLKSYQFERP